MNSATPYIKSKWRILFLFVGLGFLYLPILILMAYSFNSSRLVTVWKSFSFHWYEALVQDEEFLHAIYLTFSIGFCAATMSVIIGTLAAFVLTRFNRFKGYGIFSFSITAPMIMPEVITGLSLLLMFIAMSNGSHALVQYLLESFNIQEGNFLYPFLMQLDGFPNRGVVTIWIAMVTFTSAYVTVIVRARLKETDLSIEEAALDLGATPFKVFVFITLPSLLPAIMSGWLLAFTLTLDDIVISQFVAGPKSTTLPMLVFSGVRRGVNPKINALATIIVLVVSFCVFLAWFFMRKREKRMLREMKAIKNKG
jgi:putrescine transport system permease protein